ncbi:MAG TPA: hypothetical protein VFT22_18460 [Kofleriaceae bacterium]|nr:hypothetical protein [Kofleriaceae bacterium]
MSTLTQAFGVYRLHLRVMRANAVAYLLIGIIIPLASYHVIVDSQPSEEALRVLLGHVVFSAVLLGPRQGMNLVRLRVYGQQRLLTAFGVGHRTQLTANALYIASMMPLSLAVCAIGVAWSKLGAPAGIGWLAALALTFAAFAGVAYVISGTSKSAAGATMKINLFIMVSIAFCPLYYPLARVPGALRGVIGALPQTLCVEAMTASWRGAPGVVAANLGLAAWAVGLLALGFWAEGRRSAREAS